MEFYACDKPKKSRAENLITVADLISIGKTKKNSNTAVKCTLTFPNLTISQLVGVKEFYSVSFYENAKNVLFLIKLR